MTKAQQSDPKPRSEQNRRRRLLTATKKIHKDQRSAPSSFSFPKFKARDPGNRSCSFENESKLVDEFNKVW